MRRRILGACAMLVMASMLAGCEMLTAPGPVPLLDNVGADASGSHVVTQTKDPDAIERHLAEPVHIDEFNVDPNRSTPSYPGQDKSGQGSSSGITSNGSGGSSHHHHHRSH